MEPRPDLLPTQPLGDGEDGVREYATYGRFISLGVIGRGGMGVVLRAKDPELDRHVAIKVIGPSSSTDVTGSQRLQREAQAMARLSHPNVVTVYEIGQVGADRFIAMELVEGTTLRRWLAERARPWREIVAAFVECGRGLAAAHAAELVHRDFKPENVLIGADGRPRVSDFGLVADGAPDGGAIAGAELAMGSATTVLTVRGSVLGTPAYMAPEQWAGQDVDARTDQFAFCVALWEALYGERPFTGTTSDEIRASVLAGEPRDPPRDRKARDLAPILRRGLARTRAERWPTMTALLDRLRPRRPRWPYLVGAVGLAGAAVAAYGLLAGSATDPCPDPAARLATIWDAPVKAKIARAFTAANPAIADEVGARIGPELDRYAGQWRAASRAACRATRVEGTQSAELLDRRMLCLDRRRVELGTLTAALATADRGRVAGAIDAVGALGDLDQCANREKLLALAPPSDPEQRRKVDALAAEITASTASQFGTKPAERQVRAAATVAAARALGYLPVLVRALEEHYDAANANSDQDAQEAALRELAQRAAEAHDDTLSAKAWIDLIKLLAERRHPDEARTLEPVAEAAVARAGSPPWLRYFLLAAQGSRRMYAQDFAGAVEAMTAAVEASTTDQQRAIALLALAQVTAMKDGPAAGLPLAEDSLAKTTAAYGPGHPRTANALHMIAQLETDAGELDKAQEAESRVLALREAAFGPDHRDVAISLHMLANIAKKRKDNTTARALYERAIKIFDADRGVNDAALARGMLATLIADDDGLAAARPVFVAALDGLATMGKDQAQYATTEMNFALRLIDAKLCDEAMPLIDHATTVLAKVRPRQLPMVLEPAAACDLAAHRTGDAIAKLERARASCAAGGCPPPLVSLVAWELGRTLIESRGDRARGKQLVDEAVKLATEQEDDELLGEIAAWRKRH